MADRHHRQATHKRQTSVSAPKAFRRCCCRVESHQLLAAVVELPRLGSHLMVLRLQIPKESKRLVHLYTHAALGVSAFYPRRYSPHR